MLKHLHIRNLAIIDELDLDFNAGMTVLTGETGAGKSILIDALGLVLGDRAETGVIREDAEKSEIVAVFDISGLNEIQSVLEEQSIAPDGDEIIIRRVISRDGRSRAYINSSQVPVQLLRTIGEYLIDIHGQHEHQSLMKRSVQRTLLDFSAGHWPLLDNVNQAYLEWNGIGNQLMEIGTDPESHSSTIDLLQYQVKELEDLKPETDEYDQLEGEYKRLSNITELINMTQGVLEMLSDNELSAESTLQRAISDLGDLQKSDPSIERFSGLLNGVSIQLTDAIADIRHYADRLEINPERLNEVDKRINALLDMARKHHVHARELPGHLQHLQDRLNQLLTNRDSADKLIAEQAAALKKYRQAAEKLHKAREKAAKSMALTITDQLEQLGMPGGNFIIAVTMQEIDHPLKDGLDEVEYLVSLNPGSSPQPMRKVASGGELSRISLAIQMVSKDAKTSPSLIFDEVDAGIGGRTADIVGGLLKDLAEKHQVFCVTHLPQVASRGDNHLLVSKSSREGLTYTNVTLLDECSRVEEIARMLGGMRVSQKTREHAREMLGLESLVAGR